ncbi:PREDICTED: DDB1- and CUL4-associated factor 17-like [Branchiostoma belcheri]|uniref:DDB1- and CUL4-associated factor 17-like n=1 Tax=Branchiostoma belcheri TaxID=7741 RepID=A0A6P4ZUH8_BRABE|nr:PREDICTED: DDB1- and CUL4-associated factor 17-like [Branchiostoma belcheri]
MVKYSGESGGVCVELRERELGGRRDNSRRCVGIVRKLACEKTSTFRRIWDKESKYPISYEEGRLLFDNYRTCYTSLGLHATPQLLFRLPSCSAAEKTEDVIMCQSSLNTLPMENQGYRGCLLGLTASNWLMRWDVSTGKCLEAVYLSHRYKFRHIAWGTFLENFVVRSIHTKHTAAARAAGIPQPLLMVLAMFKVFPLRFTAMLEINKHVFGKDVTDAMISQGVLVVMYQGNTVRCFSFDDIVDKNTVVKADLYQNCGDFGTVGSYPTGLPLTVKLTERPPVLFEVKCLEHSLQMGGIPWHYLITPPAQGYKGVFHVKSLQTGAMAKNGVLDMDSVSVEPDKAFFHTDDSGRIFHMGPSTLRVLRIRRGSHGYELVPDFVIDAYSQSTTNGPQLDGMILTSSGRQVKRLLLDAYADPCYESLQGVDYESDLDILAVTSVSQRDDKLVGHVCLHDNQTGALLNRVELEEAWDETCDHTISMDLDTLVHIVRSPQRRYHCYVYKLDRTVGQIDEEQPRHKGKRRKSSRRGR